MKSDFLYLLVAAFTFVGPIAYNSLRTYRISRLHKRLQTEFSVQFLRKHPPLCRFEWHGCFIELTSEASTTISIGGITTNNVVVKIASDEGVVKPNPQLENAPYNILSEFFVETNSIDTYGSLVTTDVREAIIALQRRYGFDTIVLANNELVVTMWKLFSRYDEFKDILERVLYLHQQFARRL